MGFVEKACNDFVGPFEGKFYKLESKNFEDKIKLGNKNYSVYDNTKIEDELFLTAAHFEKDFPSGRAIFLTQD
jgi:hypothetical protein